MDFPDLTLAKTPPFSEGEGRTNPGEQGLRGHREIFWRAERILSHRSEESALQASADL